MAIWRVEQGPTRKFVLTDRAQLLDWIALIAVAAAPGFLLILFIPLPLVLPVLSIISFILACSIALFAHCSRDRRGAPTQVLWDLACAFTFVWIVSGLTSNPRHLLDWFDQLALML
jgi:hypothetical protein